MIINYVLVIGCLLDLTLTYNYLRLYKNKFPKKDFAIIEANPLIRNMIRRFGLLDGVVYSGLIIVFILLLLINFTGVNFKFFLAGAYYMMVTFHLTNYLALKRLAQGRSNKSGKKRQEKTRN